MHKDLDEKWRVGLEQDARDTVTGLVMISQSLALAREVWINAFDKAAAELDA